jgi:hypothetical protein
MRAETVAESARRNSVTVLTDCEVHGHATHVMSTVESGSVLHSPERRQAGTVVRQGPQRTPLKQKRPRNAAKHPTTFASLLQASCKHWLQASRSVRSVREKQAGKLLRDGQANVLLKHLRKQQAIGK